MASHFREASNTAAESQCLTQRRERDFPGEAVALALACVTVRRFGTTLGSHNQAHTAAKQPSVQTADVVALTLETLWMLPVTYLHSVRVCSGVTVPVPLIAFPFPAFRWSWTFHVSSSCPTWILISCHLFCCAFWTWTWTSSHPCCDRHDASLRLA